MSRVKTLLIDNYDSFTFSLFQLLADVNGEEPIVVRNDDASWLELSTWPFDNVVVSPGPGRPERPGDFGACADAIAQADVPLLGVCLGHQGLAHLAGGTVVHAPEVVHGRALRVDHDGSALFAGIPQGFEAVCYHSLCVATPAPPGLAVAAWTGDGVVMALRDLGRPRYGVQFHPESICTEHGRRLLENFRDLTRAGASPTRRGSGTPRSVVPGGRARPAPVPRRLEVRTRRLDGPLDPEAAFAALHADDPWAWWLDSSRPGPEARFSFMGGSGGPLWSRASYDVEAREVTVTRGAGTETHAEPILDHLQRELDGTLVEGAVDLPFDFHGGFVGYLGYEVKADCGGTTGHPSPYPDAVFQFADRLVAFDHATGAVHLVTVVDAAGVAAGEAWLAEVEERLAALPELPPLPAAGRGDVVELALDRSYETYLADIARCRELIAEGETYEACLTNTIEAEVTPEPLTVYRALRRLNPAPFAALLRIGDLTVCSSSPERFLRIGRDRWVEAKPIKGTAPRGRTPAEDVRLAAELRADEKSRAENLMITDLLRSDLGLVCEVGSVHVPRLFAVETYETVHQLVTTIRGRLRAGLGVTDCVRACFPGGSMTGAPKRRTMEILDELEGRARGVYSGAIGYLALGGAVELDIVIRTIVLDGQTASIGVGGAIVAQSDPELEYDETILKGRASVEAIVQAVGGGSARIVNGRPAAGTHGPPAPVHAGGADP